MHHSFFYLYGLRFRYWMGARPSNLLIWSWSQSWWSSIQWRWLPIRVLKYGLILRIINESWAWGGRHSCDDISLRFSSNKWSDAKCALRFPWIRRLARWWASWRFIYWSIPHFMHNAAIENISGRDLWKCHNPTRNLHDCQNSDVYAWL